LLKQIDWIARELHALDARVARLDLKQVAEFAGPADVAQTDIAHRQCEIGVLALTRVLAQACACALAAAPIQTSFLDFFRFLLNSYNASSCDLLSM
jgi:hypothetical protein